MQGQQHTIKYARFLQLLHPKSRISLVFLQETPLRQIRLVLELVPIAIVLQSDWQISG